MKERPILVIITFIVAAITGVNLMKHHALSTSPSLQLIFLKRRSCHRFLQSRCLVHCFVFGNSRIRLSVLRPKLLIDLLSHIRPVLAQYLRIDLLSHIRPVLAQYLRIDFLLYPSNPSSYYVLK